jgi:hypothetical protein
MEKKMVKVFFKDTQMDLPEEVVNMISQVSQLKGFELGMVDLSLVSSKLFSFLISYVSIENKVN